MAPSVCRKSKKQASSFALDRLQTLTIVLLLWNSHALMLVCTSPMFRLAGFITVSRKLAFGAFRHFGAQSLFRFATCKAMCGEDVLIWKQPVVLNFLPDFLSRTKSTGLTGGVQTNGHKTRISNVHWFSFKPRHWRIDRRFRWPRTNDESPINPTMYNLSLSFKHYGADNGAVFTSS